jgi:hypothetical protein
MPFHRYIILLIIDYFKKDYIPTFLSHKFIEKVNLTLDCLGSTAVP